MPIGGTQRPGIGGAPAPTPSPAGPPLLICGPYDVPDELERMLTHASGALAQCLTGDVESDINGFLQERAASGPVQHAEVINGLLLNILTGSLPPARLMSYMQLVTRDKYTGCLFMLQRVVAERWTKLAEGVGAKVLWMLEQLIGLGVPETEGLLYCLLRQIGGGDVSPPNLWLANAMLELLTKHRRWLYTCPNSVGLAVFTYLRLIPDHTGRKVQELRQKEVAFCLQTLRERFEDCLAVGRDLVRLLQEVTAVPELEGLCKELLSEPSVFGVREFSDVGQLYVVRTPSRYIASRVTPEMETQIRFLLSHVRMGNQRRYQAWFSHRFLAGPESETLVPDLLRFICCVVHPTNQILQSDIVPRWAIVGWLLKCCKSPHVEGSARLAVLYDWLFFLGSSDNIMNIEPAVLLMVHSIPKYADITTSLLHSLFHLLDTFDPPRREVLLKGVTNSLAILTAKGVIRSLEPILATPLIRAPLKDKLLSHFPAFCNTHHRSDAVPPPASPSTGGEGRAKRKRAMEVQEELQGELKVHFEILKASVMNSQEKAAEALEHLLLFLISSRETLWGGKVMRSTGKGDVSANGRSLSEEESAVAMQIRSVVGEGGYALCSPLRTTPGVDPSADETGSLTSTVLRLFVIKRHPMLRSMLLTWQGAGCEASARLLCYVARLGEELEVDETEEDGGGDGEGEGDEGPEVAAVTSAFEAYAEFLGEGGARQMLEADLGTCLVWNAYRFLRVLPFVFRFLPHLASGSVPIIKLLVGVGDPVEVAAMESSLGAGEFSMARGGEGGDADEMCSRLVEASVAWESEEQHLMWRLVRAEGVHWGTKTLLSLLDRVTTTCKGGAEAWSGIGACWGGRPPDAALLESVFGMNPCSGACGRIPVAIFMSWTLLHPRLLCTLLGAEKKSGEHLGGRNAERDLMEVGRRVVVRGIIKALKHRQRVRQGDKETGLVMSSFLGFVKQKR